MSSSDMDMELSMDIQHTPSQRHPRMCAFNVIVSETYYLKAEVAPGEFQVLDREGCPEEYPIPTIFFFFDSFRSTRCSDLFQQRLIVLQPSMHPVTRKYLAETKVKHMMNILSPCSEDEINFGLVVDARLEVDYFRIADEDELAPYRLFYEEELAPYRLFDELMEDVDDDEGFKGVEKGIYNGGNGKQGVITCSVCLEDLTSGMEFNRLPCSHIFHGSSIGPWFERNISCPNCRDQVEDEDASVVAIATFLRTMTHRGTQA